VRFASHLAFLTNIYKKTPEFDRTDDKKSIQIGSNWVVITLMPLTL